MHYCYSCNRNVKSTVKMIRETYRNNGKYVTVESIMRICDRCGKEIPDDKINDCNVQKVLREYQERILTKNKSKKNRSA